MNRLIAAIAALATLPTPTPVLAQPQLKSTAVVTGLAYPLGVTHAPGDPSRLFVVLQRGQIRVVDITPPPSTGYSLRPTPLVDLTSQLTSTYLEYGVLGLAFHPNWAQNGYLYVTFTPPTTPGSTNLADWALLRFKLSQSNPSVVDPASQTLIYRFTYTITQHRAGWIAFGPDGYLYATTGDGGEGDPQNNASNLSLTKGKVIRLDVNGPDGIPGTADDDQFPADPWRNYAIPADNPFVNTPGAAPEIWHYGLRNPWRASFDRLTGDLWIGDVGQGQWEEIDFAPAGANGTPIGGLNFGWRCLEGNHPTSYSGCGATVPGATPPIVEYSHTTAVNTLIGSSVTGGYVYRGCAMPSYHGVYFFGDWGGKIWIGTRSGNSLTNIAIKSTEMGNTGTMVSFGEDALGELYYVLWSTSAGAVYKIEPRTPPTDGPDCNHNNKPDACDIALFALTGGAMGSRDTNGDGIPDECQCRADVDGSLTLTTSDLFAFINLWFSADPRGDFNQMDGLTVADIFDYVNAWFMGC